MKITDLLTLIDRLRDTPIVVTGVDLDRPGPTLRFVNDAFVAMSGFSREALIGRSPRVLQGSRTDPRHTAAIGASLRAGAPCSQVLTNYRASGEPYFCCAEIHPVTDEADRIVLFAAFEMEVRRRRGRPASGLLGRWNRLDPKVSLASEVDLSLHGKFSKL